MDIIENFDEYKAWFNKYKINNDKQEIKYQNELVKPLIERICPNLDVEDCSKKGPNTNQHVICNTVVHISIKMERISHQHLIW